MFRKPQKFPKTLDERINDLSRRLERRANYYSRRGKLNYWVSLSLVTIGLASSFVIVVGGILLDTSSKVLGVIALIPSFCILVDTVTQPIPKADWYFLMSSKLTALRFRLLHQLSIPPTLDEVKLISLDWENAELQMDESWKSTIKVDLSLLTRAQRPKGTT